AQHAFARAVGRVVIDPANAVSLVDIEDNPASDTAIRTGRTHLSVGHERTSILGLRAVVGHAATQEPQEVQTDCRNVSSAPGVTRVARPRPAIPIALMC